MDVVIFWFRNDLRISDNPGLLKASKHKLVLPIFIIDHKHNLGGASLWWLTKSLKKLKQKPW